LGAGDLELRIVCERQRNRFATRHSRRIERLRRAEPRYGIGSSVLNRLLGLERTSEERQRDR
jgi:hypothetical protein